MHQMLRHVRPAFVLASRRAAFPIVPPLLVQKGYRGFSQLLGRNKHRRLQTVVAEVGSHEHVPRMEDELLPEQHMVPLASDDEQEQFTTESGVVEAVSEDDAEVGDKRGFPCKPPAAPSHHAHKAQGIYICSQRLEHRTFTPWAMQACVTSWLRCNPCAFLVSPHTLHGAMTHARMSPRGRATPTPTPHPQTYAPTPAHACTHMHPP